uniref:Putative prolipoprotein diacylglyceryl transferase n=1 Tax=termite gut metagenome TaxID=433724 RepID=S0DEQ9_9ZZZZ
MMTNFLAVTWDVDPVFFRIGSFEVMWYGLCWMLAILGGALFFINFGKREHLNPKFADTIFWWGTLATIIGARLGHCFFYEPEYYFTHPLEILNIRQGGMASHGAAVGLLLGLWGFSRQCKLPVIWSLDRIMIPVTVGGAAVRFGNLVNSEVYGGPTTLPWGFEFVRDSQWLANSQGGLPVHPTQIYEAVCYLITFAILVFMYYKMDEGRRRPGAIFGVGLIGVFLTRFVIEFIKNVQVEEEVRMIETIGINIGQILSIPFILLGIFMVVWPYTKYRFELNPNRWPGLRRWEPGKEKSKNKKKRVI